MFLYLPQFPVPQCVPLVAGRKRCRNITDRSMTFREEDGSFVCVCLSDWMYSRTWTTKSLPLPVWRLIFIVAKPTEIIHPPETYAQATLQLNRYTSMYHIITKRALLNIPDQNQNSETQLTNQKAKKKNKPPPVTLAESVRKWKTILVCRDQAAAWEGR